MDYAVEVENLTKQYPLVKRYREIILHPLIQNRMTALADISFSIKRGELFGLLGPNGAGKTTLLKILATLILPDKGTVRVNGFDAEKKPMHVKRCIGFVVTEERSFYWRLTGWQNLEFFAVLNNIKRNHIHSRINKVLQLVELTTDAHRMFKDYSAGMKQRMAIARSLLTEPDILIMDEPTRSLDPSTAKLLRHFIKHELVENQGKTVCLSTHNLHEADQLCERIAILHKSRLLACGTPGDIKALMPDARLMEIHLAKNSSPDTENAVRAICNNSGYKTVKLTEDRNEIKLELETGKYTDITSIAADFSDAGFKVLAFMPREATLEEVFDRLIEQVK